MSGSVGVWGRLAALWVLCAMLSAVLVLAGPSADAQADWSQLGADIDGENANDDSGRSVAMNAGGDTVIIGANFNDGVNGSNSGHARVYELTGGVWVQVGADIDGETAGDQSGRSVAMNSSGYAVTIGARFNAGNGDYAGHARVFRSAPEPTPTPEAPTPNSEAGFAAPVPYPGPFTQMPEPAGAPYGWGTSPVPAAGPETPTAEPAAAAGDGVAGLAHTGSTTTTLAYLAVGLIGFGALLVPASRRHN